MEENYKNLPLFESLKSPIFPGAKIIIKASQQEDFIKYSLACITEGRFIAGPVEYCKEGYTVATLVEITNNDLALVVGELVCQAKERVLYKNSETHQVDGISYVDVSSLPYEEVNPDDLLPTVTVANAFLDKLEAISKDGPYTAMHINEKTDLPMINEWIDSTVPILSRCDKKKIFAEDNTLTRLRLTAVALQMELDYEVAKKEFDEKVHEAIQESQREYFLREQMRVCTEELYGSESEIEDYENKIEALDAPEKVKEKLTKELHKLANTQSSSPESYVQRNYLNSVLELPWGILDKENTSIANARKILDEDHYGLDKVKERIIEFLAVRKMAPNKKSNILCFYGPPGVGKTSIVRSIAKAMNRKYVRASLGGVHDEAEIRGHRKTYIGSMAGRIMSSLAQVGTMNPVFLLDEIDKVGRDFKGDPASALLEVLDPEQNKAFVDNFLEIPFDLSKVLFITTCNSLDTIDQPLLDRMEIIEMSGYTIEEKREIAKRHLIPKQNKEHGINGLMEITDNAVEKLIEGYTKEAGVRKLEQQISSLARKVAVKNADISKKARTLTKIDEKDLEGYLGLKKYREDELRKDACVGGITGLAWTEYGGVTLELECRLIEGKGDVIITGNLGKVMEESAKLAVSVVKSLADEFGIDKTKFKNYDVHIHAPEGAVPKDGPSAGIALTTVILSAFADRKVVNDKALTGEITLWGRVLPIGGVKEKCLGALRAGITTVLLPEANRRDYNDLPDSIKNKVNIIFVNEIHEVLKEMLL